MNIRFSTKQLLFWLTWICIVIALFHESTFPNRGIQFCKQIKFSPDRSKVAIVGKEETRVYSTRNALLATIEFKGDDQLGMDTVEFIDDETLGLISYYDESLPLGVHIYSLTKKKIVKHLPLERGERPLILNRKVLVCNSTESNNKKSEFKTFDRLTKDAKPTDVSIAPETNMSFAASPDGRYVGFFYSYHSYPNLDFTLFDIESEKEMESSNPSTGVRFSKDGTFVICVEGNDIARYDLPSGIQKWKIRFGMSENVRISDDGSRFGVTGYSSAFGPFIFDSDNGKKVAAFDPWSIYTQLDELSESRIYWKWAGDSVPFCFSEDASSIWLPAEDDLGGIRAWDIATQTPEQRLGEPSNLRLQMGLFLALLLVWSLVFGRTTSLGHSLPTFFLLLILVAGVWVMAASIQSCFTHLSEIYEAGVQNRYAHQLLQFGISVLISSLLVAPGYQLLARLRKIFGLQKESPRSVL